MTRSFKFRCQDCHESNVGVRGGTLHKARRCINCFLVNADKSRYVNDMIEFRAYVDGLTQDA